MQILQIISVIIGVITGAFTLLTLVSSKFREWLFSAKKAKEQRAEYEADRRETDKCLLRNNITEFYYAHRREGELHQYEYENLERLYTQYKKLGGNSFIDKVWNEIKEEWTIIQ